MLSENLKTLRRQRGMSQELLGGNIESESGSDALTAQLALLNEQLAARNVRSRRITRVLVCTRAVIAVITTAILLVNHRGEAQRVRAADELIAAIELPPCPDFSWPRIYETLETAVAAVAALSEVEQAQLQNMEMPEDARQEFFRDEYSSIINDFRNLIQSCQNQESLVYLIVENIGLEGFYEALDAIHTMDRTETKAELDERLGYDST